MALLPETRDEINALTRTRDEPSRTYHMRVEEERINGQTDGLAAMEQAVYKILNTERYRFVIYSWNYGVELADLFGKPIPWVFAELPRRITEALLQDDRILAVTDFDLSHKRGDVLAKFRVQTKLGDIEAERMVNIR